MSVEQVMRNTSSRTTAPIPEMKTMRHQQKQGTQTNLQMSNRKIRTKTRRKAIK
jgi:hypothetical protein